MQRLREGAQLRLEGTLASLARGLARSGITPNQVTVAGLVITLVAVPLIMLDHLRLAGAVFLLGSAVDMLDGALARAQARTSPFGAFLDSTLDRVSEGMVLAAVAWHFAALGDPRAAAAVVLALLGGMLTSYMRARAEALGLAGTGGWLARPERVILLGAGLVFHLLAPAIYLLAVLTLVSAAQRARVVHRGLSGPAQGRPEG